MYLKLGYGDFLLNLVLLSKHTLRNYPFFLGNWNSTKSFNFLFSPTSLRKISATILVSSYDFMNELSQAYVLLDYENGILVKSPEIPMT